jgi:hypothetical protein
MAVAPSKGLDIVSKMAAVPSAALDIRPKSLLISWAVAVIERPHLGIASAARASHLKSPTNRRVDTLRFTVATRP